jgi:Kinesin motor domain
MSDPIRVICRLRLDNDEQQRIAQQSPAHRRYEIAADKKSSSLMLRRIGRRMSVDLNEPQQSQFSFDKLLDEKATQRQVYDASTAKIVRNAVRGYNGSVLAYGASQTGKSHSIFGASTTGAQRGVIPRALEELFQRLEDEADIADCDIDIGFFEIYNDRIIDLVSASQEKRPARGSVADLKRSRSRSIDSTARVRAQQDGSIIVENLVSMPVDTVEEALDVIDNISAFRAENLDYLHIGNSALGHTVVQVTLHQRLHNLSYRTAKLTFVDLAGADTMSDVEHESSDTLSLEARNINKSLLSLATVIHALTQRRRQHVPYRDSTLTFLLSDTLGGNAHTCLIVHASRLPTHYSQTMAACKFASNAKRVVNRPFVRNEETMEHLREVIATLQARNQELEMRVAELEKKKFIDPEREARFQAEIRAREDQMLSRIRASEKQLLLVRDLRETERGRYLRVMKTTSCLALLEEGDVFTKYPYSGLLGRPQIKRIAFDRLTLRLYYWDLNKKRSSGKSLHITEMQQILSGKVTDAFQQSVAKPADPSMCFSILYGTRSLDLEASSSEIRDLWVSALQHLLSPGRRSVRKELADSALPAGQKMEPDSVVDDDKDAVNEKNEVQQDELADSKHTDLPSDVEHSVSDHGEWQPAEQPGSARGTLRWTHRNSTAVHPAAAFSDSEPLEYSDQHATTGTAEDNGLYDADIQHTNTNTTTTATYARVTGSNTTATGAGDTWTSDQVNRHRTDSAPSNRFGGLIAEFAALRPHESAEHQAERPGADGEHSVQPQSDYEVY